MTTACAAPDSSDAPGIELPRVLARVDGRRGPTLIVTGSLHGNEPAGALALMRVADTVGRHAGRSWSGRLVALTGNIKALRQNRRFLSEDLNRIWLPERLARVRHPTGPLADEGEELAELDAEIRRAMADAPGPVALLDLHGMSGPGHAFVTLDDTLANRRLAMRLPSPCVLGLEEELRGTMTDFFVSQGLIAFGFEAGQLYDPASIDRAEAAVWLTLDALGIVSARDWPEVVTARERLVADRAHLPTVVEVCYRHAVDETMAFRMYPGFTSFQPVRKGQPLASTASGVVHAPMSGLLLMPLYQGQGRDGFFIVRRVHPLWLRVSSIARRLPVHHVLGWLPGVSAHAAIPGAFVIDTNRARWVALPVFHLLGFRREARLPHGLVMTPRGR